MKNPFELVDPHWAEEVPSDFFGCPYYYIDNFYKDPDAVVDLINANKPTKFLGTVVPSGFSKANLNGEHFTDERHYIDCPELEFVYHYLSHIIQFPPYENPQILQTNYQKLTTRSFNDWRNNYWYPHLDFGWTAIVYLNKNGCDGTNLYSYKGESRVVKKDNVPWIPIANEHETPWQPKSDWQVIQNIKGVYNRCAIFNGNIYHGMAVNSDQLFEEHRLNQVMFFHGTLHSSSV
jgi:hypothetical protein